MRTLKISRERRDRFLTALSEAGSAMGAAEAAGLAEKDFEEFRLSDRGFAAQWQAAQRGWMLRLHQEARRRALEGDPDPVVSNGVLVRDDEQSPLSVQRYSDQLLLALLRANDPEGFGNYHLLKVAVVWPRWLRLLLAVAIFAFALWVAGDLVLGAIDGRPPQATQSKR